MDLPFADFEVRDGSKRPYPAPGLLTEGEQENAPGSTSRGRFVFMEHETRFELATLTLARRCRV